MSTAHQIQANRLNSQHSTGPRSDEGKRASSQNALKSGLDAASQFLPGESPEEFAQLKTELYDHHAPANPDERFHVDQLVRNEWFLKRYARVEDQLWLYNARLAERGTGVELAEAFSKANSIFMRLQRRITAAEKSHKDALAELKRLRAAAPPPQPQETKAETPDLASFLIGAPLPPDSPQRQAVENLLREEMAAKVGQALSPAGLAETDNDPEDRD